MNCATGAAHHRGLLPFFRKLKAEVKQNVTDSFGKWKVTRHEVWFPVFWICLLRLYEMQENAESAQVEGRRQHGGQLGSPE